MVSGRSCELLAAVAPDTAMMPAAMHGTRGLRCRRQRLAYRGAQRHCGAHAQPLCCDASRRSVQSASTLPQQLPMLRFILKRGFRLRSTPKAHDVGAPASLALHAESRAFTSTFISHCFPWLRSLSVGVSWKTCLGNSYLPIFSPRYCQ